MHLSGMKEAPEIALQDAQEDPFIGLMVFNTHTQKNFSVGHNIMWMGFKWALSNFIPENGCVWVSEILHQLKTVVSIPFFIGFQPTLWWWISKPPTVRWAFNRTWSSKKNQYGGSLGKPFCLVVGGFNPSEKYEFVSWDDKLPIYYGQS